jgi:hypothetical protein
LENKILDKVTGSFELDLPKDFDTIAQYIEFIVPRIQAWSEDLQEEDYYLNTRWIEIRDDDYWDKPFIRIFMKGGELILSDRGDVYKGAWRYLKESNTMIVDINNRTLLYDLIFMNADFFILKKNGTAEYLTMGNENVVSNKRLDWRNAMEELYNIYRSNSKFSMWLFLLVIIVIAVIAYSLS